MSFFKALVSPITAAYNAAVKPALEASGLGVIADGIEAAGDTFEDLADEIGEGLMDLGEGIGDTLEDIGEELEEGFSKEGWMTKFVEEYVPAGGLVTAIVHIAADNEDYARAAALKGTITMVEAATTIAGTIALGPAGGVLGAGIGNGIGQILEISLRETLPPSVMHLFPPETMEEALMGMGTAMAGAGIGSGVGKGAGRLGRGLGNIGKTADEIAENAAKRAAKDAVQKTTRELVETALLKKYILSTTKPLQEELLDEAGLPVRQRRGTASSEQLEKVELFEQKLIVRSVATLRYEQSLEGAPPEQLARFDRQIFAATTKLEQMESGGVDQGQFYAYQHDTLGTYYMRDGVVVWELDELAEATKRIELDNLGMTEGQLERAIEARIKAGYDTAIAAGAPSGNSEWTLQHDAVLGDYMIRDGEVVWGVRTIDDARARYSVEEARERGFASVEDYRAELVNSWKIAHQYAVEAGTATGEWQPGGQSDIVGDYMIRNGQIVWGAKTPDEADAMLPDQLAREKGFDGVEALRDTIESSWRTSHRYDEEAGTTTGEWKTGGQSDIVGDYMIKNGVVVWGASDREEAEELLPMQLVRNRGFSSMEEYRQELETSWRMAYDGEEEAGTDNDEWQVGGQSEVTGPYMIRRGIIAWGATTVEEADRIMGERIREEYDLVPPVPDATSDESAIPDEFPDDFDSFDPDQVETPVLIVTEPDDGMPLDIRRLDETPRPPAPTVEDDTIAELRAQIEALQRQVETLQDEVAEATTPSDRTGSEEAAQNDPDGSVSSGFVDLDTFDDPPPSSSDEDEDAATDETEMTPAVMPADPLDWNEQHGHPDGEPVSVPPVSEPEAVGAMAGAAESPTDEPAAPFDFDSLTPTLPDEVPVEAEPWSGNMEDFGFANDSEDRDY